MSTTTTTSEIDGLKARLKETWMAGDYDRFSRYMEQGARIFYEQLDVPAGMPTARCGLRLGSGRAMGGTRWSERHRRGHCAEPGAACTGACQTRKVSMPVSLKATPKLSRLKMAASTS